MVFFRASHELFSVTVSPERALEQMQRLILANMDQAMEQALDRALEKRYKTVPGTQI